MAMWVKLLIGGGIGLLAGGVLGHLGKCSSGTCPLTANPYRGALFGAILGLLIAGAVSRGGSGAAAEAAYAKIDKITTPAQFEKRVLQADKPVLVDFYTAGCGYCKLLAPTIARLADEYQGRADVVRVDCGESGELRDRYGVEGYPTVLIFRGGQVAKTLVGAREAGEYRAALDAAIQAMKGAARE